MIVLEMFGIERLLNFEIKFEKLINADKSERNWMEGIYIIFRRMVVSLTQFDDDDSPLLPNVF